VQHKINCFTNCNNLCGGCLEKKFRLLGCGIPAINLTRFTKDYIYSTDLDNPDVAITKGFTLLAPPGKPEIVSPITTNLVARVKAGQTLSQAEAAVKTEFGLPNIDLYKNYISAKATDANYQQLHNLAAAMVEVAKNVESSDTNLTLSQKLSLVSASVKSCRVLSVCAVMKSRCNSSRMLFCFNSQIAQRLL